MFYSPEVTTTHKTNNYKPIIFSSSRSIISEELVTFDYNKFPSGQCFVSPFHRFDLSLDKTRMLDVPAEQTDPNRAPPKKRFGHNEKGWAKTLKEGSNLPVPRQPDARRRSPTWFHPEPQPTPRNPPSPQPLLILEVSIILSW